MLSASALDIALIKFRCLSPVLICVVLWLDIGHFCSCSGLSPLTFLVPHGGGSSYSALVDLGGPSLCLNSGPGSEPGVNEGLGSLLFSLFLISAYF